VEAIGLRRTLASSGRLGSLCLTCSVRADLLSPLADEPFDEYVGACAKQIVELAKANGQL
jgi:hypothetical protein